MEEGTSVNRDHASVVRVQRVWSEQSWEVRIERQWGSEPGRTGQEDDDQDGQLRDRAPEARLDQMGYNYPAVPAQGMGGTILR
jgi:hypothetical protein